MSELTDAMKGSLGHLQLRTLPSTAFLTPEGETAIDAEVKVPGAVIGRGEDADIRIRDEDGYISRRHLLIEPYGLQWVIRDDTSTHGTRLQGVGIRLDLPPQVPMPLASGDEIILAGIAAFSVQIVVNTPSGTRTKDAPGGLAAVRIGDADVLNLAYELVRPRRENPSRTTAPSAKELMDTFHVAEKTIYNRRDKIIEIPAIKRLVREERPPMNEVADAVAVVFPHLLEPRRGP